MAHEKRETEKRKFGGGGVRDTTFKGGGEKKKKIISGFVRSEAVPAGPSGTCTLQRG